MFQILGSERVKRIDCKMLNQIDYIKLSVNQGF